MHVNCPHCQTKFDLPDAAFKPGAKARCSVCKNVFKLQEPQAEPETPDFDMGAADLGDDLGDDGQEDGGPARSAAKGGGGYEIPDDLAGASAEDLAAEDAADMDLDEDPAAKTGAGAGAGGDADLSFNLDDKPAPNPKKKGGALKIVLIVLAVLVVLAGGAGAGLYFFAPQLLPFGPGRPAPEAGAPAPEAATDNIKNLAIESVRQYYITNDKVGQVFVIEGKVVNRFDVPKELITVEASLFDEQGAVVDSKRQRIGNTLVLFQLQMNTQEELEAALTDNVGVSLNNTNVPPGGEVPFMITFYNPPETVREFAVKVVEAQEPPPQ